MLIKAASLIVTLLLAFTISPVLAQTTSTPTPAPSKTPTEMPEAESTAEISSAGSSRILPWTQDDLQILTGNVQRPNGITWLNNKLYTACNGDFTLYEIDATTAVTRTYIFGVRNAHTLYAEASESGRVNLWVPDFETNQVLFIDGSGTPQSVLSLLEGPWGIAYLNENEFLVTNQRGDSLTLFNRQGVAQEVLADLRAPTGVTVHEGSVYVANYGRPRQAIEWFSAEDLPALNSEGEAATPEITRETLVSGLQNVTGLTMAPDEYLYFAYSLGTRGVVGRVDPQVCRENGGCTNEDVEIVLYSELAAPLAGLTISPDMRLFVHTMFSPDIHWLQLDDPTRVGSSDAVDG